MIQMRITTIRSLQIIKSDRCLKIETVIIDKIRIALLQWSKILAMLRASIHLTWRPFTIMLIG